MTGTDSQPSSRSNLPEPAHNLDPFHHSLNFAFGTTEDSIPVVTDHLIQLSLTQILQRRRRDVRLGSAAFQRFAGFLTLADSFQRLLYLVRSRGRFLVSVLLGKRVDNLRWIFARLECLDDECIVIPTQRGLCFLCVVSEDLVLLEP